MCDPRLWQGQTFGHGPEPFPVLAPVLLASPSEAGEPDVPHLVEERVEGTPVIRQTIVAVYGS